MKMQWSDMDHMEHYKLENSHLIYKDVKNECSQTKRMGWVNTLHFGKCLSGGFIIPGVLTWIQLWYKQHFSEAL